MKILVLDNYDSFTYNLVHYVEDITGNLPDIYRNDELSIEEVKKYDVLILSPGPGLPSEAGILNDVIRTYSGKIPIFGVCLGLQAVVEVFGGELENLENVYHGVASNVNVTKSDCVLFENLPKKIEVARYHSWVASKNNFPKDLEITCEDENGKIMAIRHKTYKIEAVQFHPESILTPNGKQMIDNFLNYIKSTKK